MPVKKYRKKPVVIEACQWTGDNVEEISEFMGESAMTQTEEELKIFTLEGTMTASNGDFIIKGIEGEFYPCKPDIFANTYEEVV